MTEIGRSTRGRIDNNFRIICWLGEGMSCNVFRAESQQGQEVAIKIYNSDSIGPAKVKEFIKTETGVQRDVIQYHENVV